MMFFNSSICFEWKWCSSWPNFLQYSWTSWSLILRCISLLGRGWTITLLWRWWFCSVLLWLCLRLLLVVSFTLIRLIPLNSHQSFGLWRLENPHLHQLCFLNYQHLSKCVKWWWSEWGTLSQPMGVEARNKGCILWWKLVQQIVNQLSVHLVNATILKLFS